MRVSAEWVARLFDMKSDGVMVRFHLKWWARPLLWLRWGKTD